MRARRQRNSLPAPKNFSAKASFIQRLPPLWDRTIFGQVFARGGMIKFSKWKVPPTGGSSAPQQPFGRTNGVGGSPLIAPQSRRWADGAAGRCSACHHRRSTSPGRVARAERVGLSAGHSAQPPSQLTVQERSKSYTVCASKARFIRM